MFITFEGPEGSGKSSQIHLLADYLRRQGFSVLETREPGGTQIGDQIRSCLHDVANVEMQAVTEVLLYSASRAQLIKEIILPALAEDLVVLSDRYADSTIAYQGYGRGLTLSDLFNVTGFATDGLKPDLTLLLDIEVERGLARRLDGGEEMNRLDLETVEFHQRVRRGYHELLAAEPERWVSIDADRSVEEVQAELQAIVMARLPAT